MSSQLQHLRMMFAMNRHGKNLLEMSSDTFLTMDPEC